MFKTFQHYKFATIILSINLFQYAINKMQRQQPFLKIDQFKEEHLEAVADLITKSFISLNKIWQKFELPFDQVKSVIRGKILPTIHNNFSFVMLENDVICGAVIQMNILQYMQCPSMPNQLEFFKVLGKVGSALEGSLDKKSLQKEVASYGLYAVIDPEFAKKGYSLRFWWQLFTVGRSSGYQYFYSRISNEVSLNMLMKLGAQIMSQAETIEGDPKSKMWMVRINLTKPFPTYSMLKSMMVKSLQPRAKL